MPLHSHDESKSMRIGSQNSEGVEVFSAGATYGKRSISINFDMFDSSYCLEHKDEVEEAITAFISRFNKALKEDNLPTIKA